MRALALLDLRRADPLADTVGLVRDALRADKASLYGLRRDTDGVALAFMRNDRVVPMPGYDVEREMERWVRGAPHGFFDPLRPERAQRNRVVVFGPSRVVLAGEIPDAIARLPIAEAEREKRLAGPRVGAELFRRVGVGDLHHARALLCDGPALLAWVGVYHGEPIDPARLALFRAILPALRDRLRALARLGALDSDVYDPLAQAVLDRVSSAAWVFDARGRVRLENAAAARWLARGRRELRSALAAAARGGRLPGVDVTRVDDGGASPLFLAVATPPTGSGVAASEAARVRYGLSRREADVLEHLVDGATNRAIAVELDLGERTIETHVAAILRKLDCASRAAVVARVRS